MTLSLADPGVSGPYPYANLASQLHLGMDRFSEIRDKKPTIGAASTTDTATRNVEEYLNTTLLTYVNEGVEWPSVIFPLVEVDTEKKYVVVSVRFMPPSMVDGARYGDAPRSSFETDRNQFVMTLKAVGITVDIVGIETPSRREAAERAMLLEHRNVYFAIREMIFTETAMRVEYIGAENIRRKMYQKPLSETVATLENIYANMGCLHDRPLTSLLNEIQVKTPTMSFPNPAFDRYNIAVLPASALFSIEKEMAAFQGYPPGAPGELPTVAYYRRSIFPAFAEEVRRNMEVSLTPRWVYKTLTANAFIAGFAFFNSRPSLRSVLDRETPGILEHNEETPIYADVDLDALGRIANEQYEEALRNVRSEDAANPRLAQARVEASVFTVTRTLDIIGESGLPLPIVVRVKFTGPKWKYIVGATVSRDTAAELPVIPAVVVERGGAAGTDTAINALGRAGNAALSGAAMHAAQYVADGQTGIAEDLNAADRAFAGGRAPALDRFTHLRAIRVLVNGLYWRFADLAFAAAGMRAGFTPFTKPQIHLSTRSHTRILDGVVDMRYGVVVKDPTMVGMVPSVLIQGLAGSITRTIRAYVVEGGATYKRPPVLSPPAAAYDNGNAARHAHSMFPAANAAGDQFAGDRAARREQIHYLRVKAPTMQTHFYALTSPGGRVTGSISSATAMPITVPNMRPLEVPFVSEGALFMDAVVCCCPEKLNPSLRRIAKGIPSLP